MSELCMSMIVGFEFNPSQGGDSREYLLTASSVHMHERVLEQLVYLCRTWPENRINLYCKVDDPIPKLLRQFWPSSWTKCALPFGLRLLHGYALSLGHLDASLAWLTGI